MSKGKYELPKNVLKVIDEASKIVGNFESDMFNMSKWNECFDCNIYSPIEQILYVAFEAVRQILSYDNDDPEEFQGQDVILGMGLTPQYNIGKYRVDFLAFYGRISGKKYLTKQVIVECDSQEFHERTEKERRYEKARDRFFQREGYTALHITGKEIIENPYRVAAEIISFLAGATAEDIMGEVEQFK